jgi:NDP-sugar pyrophosphorylase family protein
MYSIFFFKSFHDTSKIVITRYDFPSDFILILHVESEDWELEVYKFILKKRFSMTSTIINIFFIILKTKIFSFHMNRITAT